MPGRRGKDLTCEIVGARKGTDAEYRFDEVQPYIGRLQHGFAQNVYANIWPVGTLAKLGEVWFEVGPGVKAKKYNRTYREIVAPEPDQILRRMPERD